MDAPSACGMSPVSPARAPRPAPSSGMLLVPCCAPRGALCAPPNALCAHAVCPGMGPAPPGCARAWAVTPRTHPGSPAHPRMSPKRCVPSAAPLRPPSWCHPAGEGCVGCCIIGVGGCWPLDPPCQPQGWLGLQAGGGRSPQPCCRTGRGSSCSPTPWGRASSLPGARVPLPAGTCSHLGTFLQEPHLPRTPRDHGGSAPVPRPAATHQHDGDPTASPSVTVTPQPVPATASPPWALIIAQSSQANAGAKSCAVPRAVSLSSAASPKRGKAESEGLAAAVARGTGTSVGSGAPSGAGGMLAGRWARSCHTSGFLEGVSWHLRW